MRGTSSAGGQPGCTTTGAPASTSKVAENEILYYLGVKMVTEPQEWLVKDGVLLLVH